MRVDPLSDDNEIIARVGLAYSLELEHDSLTLSIQQALHKHVLMKSMAVLALSLHNVLLVFVESDSLLFVSPAQDAHILVDTLLAARVHLQFRILDSDNTIAIFRLSIYEDTRTTVWLSGHLRMELPTLILLGLFSVLDEVIYANMLVSHFG